MHIDAANAFAVRSIDNHIYRAHKKKTQEIKKISFKEKLRKIFIRKMFSAGRCRRSTASCHST